MDKDEGPSLAQLQHEAFLDSKGEFAAQRTLLLGLAALTLAQSPNALKAKFKLREACENLAKPLHSGLRGSPGGDRVSAKLESELSAMLQGLCGPPRGR